MKTMNYVYVVLLTVLIFSSCENHEEEATPLADQESRRGFWKHKRSTKQFVPFYAKLKTSMTPTDEVEDCEAPFDFFNNQEGEGKIFPFGKFTTKITFCVNFSTLEYKDGNGIFSMQNGDELYFTVAGQILPSEDPEYDLEFHDKFFFTGGTGKFKGASGWGITNSYVHLFPEGGDQTDHEWRGVIILQKKHHKKWNG